MANKKVQLKILEHEDKTGQNGRDYTRFKTSDGWMSAFDKEIIDELKKAEGRICSLDISATEKDGRTFWNIHKFNGIVAPGLEDLKQANKETKELIAEVVKPESLGKSVYEPTSMYVSYAKDIFIALLEDMDVREADKVMNRAIELVKQAHKAFE